MRPAVLSIFKLTIRTHGLLGIKRACRIVTIASFDLFNVTTDQFMWLRKAGGHTKLMKPFFTPLVLFPDPSGLYEVSLAFSDGPTIRMIKMGLPPRDLSVDVAVRNYTGSQQSCSEGLYKLNHDAIRVFLNANKLCLLSRSYVHSYLYICTPNTSPCQ
jgi:hypothetical protein